MEPRELLAMFAEAIHRPADHPLGELLAAVDACVGGAPAKPTPQPPPAPPAEPSDPDTPAPMFTTPPAPFGTEGQPGG